jgi:hypothetical protein
MDVHISDAEHQCIKRLVKHFEAGNVVATWKSPEELAEALGIPVDKYRSILSGLEQYGVIEEVSHADMQFQWFKISPRSVQVLRKLEHAQREVEQGQDVVQRVQSAVRRWPVTAWIIIIFLAAGVLLTFVNQVLELLIKVGVIDAAKK